MGIKRTDPALKTIFNVEHEQSIAPAPPADIPMRRKSNGHVTQVAEFDISKDVVQVMKHDIRCPRSSLRTIYMFVMRRSSSRGHVQHASH
jgi:hypothetical protein